METLVATGGMVVAPHRAAAEAGAEVLAAGGTAVDSMIAAAATIAVVYPHMNGLGGDGVWLVAEPGRPPKAILAIGPAAGAATIARYRAADHDRMPCRGPEAAATVAGTVAGWALAHEIARALGGGLPLPDLLHAAIRHAKEGIAVTANEAHTPPARIAEVAGVPGFAAAFLVDGKLPEAGHVRRFARLADVLDHLANAGLDDFYRGDVGHALAQDLERAGAPVAHADLRAFRTRLATPPTLETKWGRLWNTPLPTQGVAALALLGIFERLGVKRADGFDVVHGLVEATKEAFRGRNTLWADPAAVDADPAALLDAAALEAAAARIDRRRAAPCATSWPAAANGGDAVWLGAIDRKGVAVSFIQSTFFEYGSGLVLPQTGILWQNRAAAFSLDPAAVGHLAPGRLPPHTLCPAMARLSDGRTAVYGATGGDGQPQAEAAVFARAIAFGMDVGEAIAAPRWLLGRTGGESSATLNVEDGLDPDVVTALDRAGHRVETAPARSGLTGHAGMIVRRPDGRLDGAHDPRSDGGAAAG